LAEALETTNRRNVRLWRSFDFDLRQSDHHDPVNGSKQRLFHVFHPCDQCLIVGSIYAAAATGNYNLNIGNAAMNATDRKSNLRAGVANSG
jgi:hypothetical protein